jgi:ribosomal protein L11 methylase PrmA
VLGFGGIVAVDNDPVAVEATRENLARNGVRADVRLVDATATRLPRADLVLANLVLEPLVRLLPLVVAPRVLVSGLLRSQAELATESFRAAGYVVRERVELEGWIGMALANADPAVVPTTASVL